MSRFTLALQLTLDTGLSITKSLRLSLEATGNAYFAAHADGVVQSLKNGKTLHEGAEASNLFPSDFLEMVHSSEASGSVPEMMRQLAHQYQEETTRKMTYLTTFAGGAVWCCVAGFIIWASSKSFALPRHVRQVQMAPVLSMTAISQSPNDVHSTMRKCAGRWSRNVSGELRCPNRTTVRGCRSRACTSSSSCLLR